MQILYMEEETIMEKTIIINTTDLARLEGVIQKNIGAFYEVGKALMEIRDKELYKLKNGGDYQTFESYCKGVWDMGRAYAYRLMDSANVVDTVSPNGQQIPKNERQARALLSLPSEQQTPAWQQAVSTAPDGKVTAAHVTKIVKQMTTKETIIEIPTTNSQPNHQQSRQEPSDAMQFAMIAISQLERIHPDDPCRGEALCYVENWIEQNKKRRKK